MNNVDKIMMYTDDQSAAIAALRNSINNPDASREDRSIALWRTLIHFQGYPFTTAGRGDRPGVKFMYSIKRNVTLAGRHYSLAPDVDGYGNEMLISGIPGVSDRSGKQKTITRSSVDRALAVVLSSRTGELDDSGIEVSGPKKLGVYGASYIYAAFKEFRVIKPQR